jgi:hypothetical protein
MYPAGRPAIRDRWPIGSTRPGVDRKASVEIRRGGAEDVCILIRWAQALADFANECISGVSGVGDGIFAEGGVSTNAYKPVAL